VPCESGAGRLTVKQHFRGAFKVQNVTVRKRKMCEQVRLITYRKTRESYMECGPHVARHGLLKQPAVTNSGRQSEEQDVTNVISI
jgi:hypothetical protein